MAHLIPAFALDQAVLGHYPDYVHLADELEAVCLNMPDGEWKSMDPSAQWATTKAFLDEVVAGGKDVILATPKESARQDSWFERELAYLFALGYGLSSDGKALLPPAKD